MVSSQGVDFMEAQSRRAARAARPRKRPGTSLQSKLLAMLIAVSAVSIGVIGTIGYISGTDSLRAAVYDQLTSLRDARASEIANLFDGITYNVMLTSEGRAVIDATKGFSSAYADMEGTPADAADTAKVEAYYRDTFVPTYESRTGATADAGLFMPTSPAAIRLQALYTAPFADFDTAAQQDDAGDGSAWSKVSADVNPFLRHMAQRFVYDDVVLLDTKGHVVYTLYKGIDLGADLTTGPFSRSGLADAYNQAMRSSTADQVVFSDFEPYEASYGSPTAWGVTPVSDRGTIVGALAVQFPDRAINNLMTDESQWQQEGLGETGETYLVGPDSSMRSVSRELISTPDAYREQVVVDGLEASVADRIVQSGDSVLLQPVRSESAQAIGRNESGTVIERNYLGHEVLSAYAPVKTQGADWGIVASIDTSEAFAPIATLTKTIIITAAGLLVAVALLSLVLARYLTRPIRALAEGVREVRAGDLDASVPVTSRDEVGDLTHSFNELSRGLRAKEEVIDQQRREHDDLLTSLMPADVAARFTAGESNIADVHENAAVVYADIAGLDEHTLDLSAERGVEVVNELLRSFSSAADRLGVENVRALRSGYLASSGISTPRVDNVRRMVDFAVEMARIVDRYNHAHGSSLEVRAGIDSGQVISGLVGRGTLAYDLWGSAVVLAHAVHDSATDEGVFITSHARDLLGDAYRLQPVLPVDGPDGPVDVWRVEEK